MTNKDDRNFDNIADHFANKIYGGLKGEIRLAVLRRDLVNKITDLQKQNNRPLRILDIGAGLAQISMELAEMGHEVIINDISKNMLTKAKQRFYSMSNDVESKSLAISWIASPYQQLNETLPTDEKFDVILCHAVLEWLAEPKDFIDFAKRWLANDGLLSLCFYNPASFVYRNLMMGNFNLLNNPDFQSDNDKSLTPNHPVDKEEVFTWLAESKMEIAKISGLRVFYDYITHKRGGLANEQDLIKMEVYYSDQEPYKWMGRYLHVLAVSK